MPGNSHTKGRRRVRGDGRKAHLRLLQAQILPGSEAFEPVVYLGRIHLVGMLMSSACFDLHDHARWKCDVSTG